MAGADGNLNHPPKPVFKVEEKEGKDGKTRKRKVPVTLHPQLPRVREMTKREAKFTHAPDIEQQMAKREAFVARENERRSWKRQADRAGFKTVEQDGSKAKIKEAPKRFVVLEPIRKPIKPKFKHFGLFETKAAKMLSPQDRVRKMENYKRARAEWVREKKRRGAIRDQMTRGGIFSVGYRAPHWKPSETLAERARIEARNKKVWSLGNMVRAAIGVFAVGMGGAQLGAQYSRDQFPTEDATGAAAREGEQEVGPRYAELNWQPVSFTEAFRAAQRAEDVTGVDADLILAVMTQESGWEPGTESIGHNIGDCRMLSPQEADARNVPFGTGIRLSKEGTGSEELIPRAMNMERDWQPFLEITSRLNLDPYHTPFSCPVYDREARRYMGYGGAMGPDQVIPSSWIKMDEEIRMALGTDASNPWSIDDAALATAIHLREDGAAQATMTSAEGVATSRYYAGARYRTPEGQRYRQGVERNMRDQAAHIARIRAQDAQTGGAAAPAEVIVPDLEGETVAVSTPPAQTP